MANLSKQRRERMLDFLQKVRDKNKDDDEALVAINEIENEIVEKRYGLVWEEHSEKVEERMADEVPVFIEDVNNEITLTGDGYNFLLEGDNLHSLHLLEKTNKGNVDVIYIDPPYNTGTDKFLYDDCIVDSNDTFRHSKWCSFMYRRLSLAKKLLSNNWSVFISIDDNELANLRHICDSVFGEANFVGDIAWESKTKSQNTESAYRKLQPKVEHILCYASSGTKHKFNLINVGERQYDKEDERGVYREYQLEVMGANGMRGRETMVFDIEGIMPPDGMQWKLGKDQINAYKASDDLFIRGNKVIIKKRPDQERSSKTIPFWGFFDKTIGTAESGKKELSNILGFDHGFETVKPTSLMKRILFHASKNNSVILDFFAGSATTGQAVMELNEEDGGHRRFILCTDNESNICDGVAYPRLKTVITGTRQDGSEYSDGIPTNLKYYHTGFIPKTADPLAEDLLKHIDEMIQLEYGVKIDKEKYISVLCDADADELEKNWSNYPNIHGIYISSKVLLTAKQRDLFDTKDCFIIPDYYFRNELREAGEI